MLSSAKGLRAATGETEETGRDIHSTAGGEERQRNEGRCPRRARDNLGADVTEWSGSD